MRYFHFHTDDPDLDWFDAPLKSKQCEKHTKSGARCKKKVIIGAPICWQHLKSQMFLEVNNSTINGAGKGLFARKPSAPDNEIIFKKGDFIANYSGQIITQEELLRRYGDYTAPYGMELSKKSRLIEDAALARGVGSLINHKPRGANVKFIRGRNNRVRLHATKNIKNNDELFTNYGREYRFNEPTRSSTNNSKYLV